MFSAIENANDTVATDTTRQKKEKEAKKDKDAKKEKENEYETLIKKGGSFQQGLFGVRHIEKDWYFEVPEDALGRLMLAVTRFGSVPQGFTKLTGEEVQHHLLREA